MIRIFDISACIRAVAAVLGKHGATVSDAEEVFRSVVSGAAIDPQANRNSREPGKFMPEDNSGKGESPDKSAVTDRKAAVNRSGWYGKMYINNPVEMAYKVILLLEKERTPRVCVDEILETVKSILEFQEVIHTPRDMESTSFPK